MVNPNKLLVALAICSSSLMASAHNATHQAINTVQDLDKYQKCMELFNSHPSISRKLLDLNITICAQFLPHPNVQVGHPTANKNKPKK